MISRIANSTRNLKGVRYFFKLNFPYKFGNVSNIRNSNSASQKLASRIKRDTANNFTSGIQVVYKSLLTTLAKNQINALSKFCEKNLYTTFETGLDKLNKRNYKLRVINEDKPINVEINEASLIIGGFIDREKEYKNRIRIIPMPSGTENIVFCYMPDYSLKEFNAPEMIIKIHAIVRTSLKLILQNNNIENIDLNTHELHEITIEGDISNPIKLFNFSSYENNYMQGFLNALNTAQSNHVKAILNSEQSFANFTIVDFDNALNGNKHKDSAYL